MTYDVVKTSAAFAAGAVSALVLAQALRAAPKSDSQTQVDGEDDSNLKRAYMLYQRLAPACDAHSHKGSAGRIGIYGGSAVYTGAPYYVAMAALRSGAELCKVFTIPEAAFVIKTYSPELMVAPCSLTVPLKNSPLFQDLPRLHAVVVGNGFGQDPQDEKVLVQVLHQLRATSTPTVVDADGVKAIMSDLNSVIGHSACVLTPNRREFELLAEKLGIAPLPPASVRMRTLLETCVKRIAKELGYVTIVLKGTADIISDGRTVVICDVRGSYKRPGGLGDILAGIIGALMPWHKTLSGSQPRKPAVSLPEVAWVGCSILRRATYIASERHGRALTAPDVLAELTNVLPRP
eukprot:GEMP01057601.1.p1 GENE.GEMP01057601.1~~GEMP01057601.1.p1  ORF type:complete len:349 (+),score=66.66 GEMP01057601.1:94-1140(+)